ncbi:MAG TPA: SPOR domain-containing protein [Steroidobacteraceae bacterium]|nr:SPOR domain-containing protein [Steroidobacteraceae bacterium]
MRRSSVERRLGWLVMGPLAALAASAAFAQISATAPSRLVDVIQVDDHDNQADVNMVFGCSMRFVTNVPANEGREVNIQLMPLADCRVSPFGQAASEIPPFSGGTDIVTAARVQSLAPGQITITLTFAKKERFVIAQGVDPRGLRLRLLDRARGKVRVLGGQDDSVSNFAINLDSQPAPFPPQAIALAHDRLQAPAFVSEVVVDGVKWYRLRVGPIDRRSEADRLLALALPDYPRAWLAIGDDAVTSDANAATGQVPLPAVERIGSDPALPPEQLRQMLTDARAAMSAHNYPEAIALLTKLQRQPEFPDRARAQELLGLARERSGELAHAKAEYEEYLRRYPHGEAAERIEFRLKILRAAEAKARTGREVGTDTQRWQVSGGFAQMFRYDGTRVTNGPPPTPTNLPPAADTTQDSAIFTDIDLLARRRGETFDWLGRLSAGYDKAFEPGGANLGDATRVSLASIEMLDKPVGLLGRVGRQVNNTGGILGTFDGVFLSWQFRPSWAIDAAAGYPVDLLTVAPQTQRRFESLALLYTPRNAHWDCSIFAVAQDYNGLTDRHAVGFEGRYLASRASLVALLDYDMFYHSLNTASLLGTLQLPARWTLSLDAERRNSPILTTGNALIGQPVTNLGGLQELFTLEQIYQAARDRTPIASNYSFTATRPLGQRFQFTAVVSATQTGATPASFGVNAQPATGLLYTYQAQFYGSDLWSKGDFNVVTLTHGNTEIGRIDSVSLTSRLPVGGAWRLAPRITVQRLSEQSDNSSQTSYIPSALLDYQHRNQLLQLEVGGELGSREAFLQLANGQFVQTQKTTRYYASLSYRLTFQN